MNRSSNLLNGSLLGTAGRLTSLFLQVSEWGSAQSAAVLYAGRKLVSSNTLKEASTSSILSSGRGMAIAFNVEQLIAPISLSAGKYLIGSTETTQADTTASITSYRKLKCSTAINQTQINIDLSVGGKFDITEVLRANSVIKFQAGRPLKAVSSNAVSSAVNLTKLQAVSLSDSAVMTAQATNTLTKKQAVRLSVTNELVAQSLLTLRKLVPISLVTVKECKAETTATLRKLVQVSMPISLIGSVVSPVSLLKGAKLRSVLSMVFQLNTSDLSESTRSRAPLKRTAYVLGNSRTSVISGN